MRRKAKRTKEFLCDWSQRCCFFLTEASDLWGRLKLELGGFRPSRFAYKLQRASRLEMILLSGSELFLVCIRESVSWLDLWVHADQAFSWYLFSRALAVWIWRWASDWEEWQEDHIDLYIPIRIVSFHGSFPSTSQPWDGHSQTPDYNHNIKTKCTWKRIA